MWGKLNQKMHFQRKQSRDLLYFKRNLLELVTYQYGYKHLHRGDLNEHGNFEKGKLVLHGYNMFVCRRS